MRDNSLQEPVMNIIEESKGWQSISIKDLWKYRELFYFLSLRDVKVRYKQTLFGVLWALLQPLVSVLIFTFLFGSLVQVPVENLSYPIFILSGWLPWMFFLSGVTTSAGSLVADANLLKKVYFPRLIMPISKICAGVVEFGITLGLLIVMMLYQGYSIGIELILLPLALLYLFLITSGIGIWLSAINAIFRDVNHAVPFLLQMWFFLSPVVYPITLLSAKGQLIYSLNPMTGVIELFRWILLGRYLEFPHLPMALALSITTGLILFISGTFYFRRMEKLFADVV